MKPSALEGSVPSFGIPNSLCQHIGCSFKGWIWTRLSSGSLTQPVTCGAGAPGKRGSQTVLSDGEQRGQSLRGRSLRASASVPDLVNISLGSTEAAGSLESQRGPRWWNCEAQACGHTVCDKHTQILQSSTESGAGRGHRKGFLVAELYFLS